MLSHENRNDWDGLRWAGVCFSDFGHEVVCVDKDHFKIETLRSGKVPIYELMVRN